MDKTLSSGSVFSLSRRARSIACRTAQPSRALMCFCYVHPYLKISFQATSGTFRSYVIPLHALDTRLLFGLRKRSNVRYNVVPSVRLASLLSTSSASALLAFTWKRCSGPLAVEIIGLLLLLLSCMPMHFQLRYNLSGVRPYQASLEARTSSTIGENPVVYDVLPPVLKLSSGFIS